jgi:hypothetical protein
VSSRLVTAWSLANAFDRLARLIAGLHERNCQRREPGKIRRSGDYFDNREIVWPGNDDGERRRRRPDVRCEIRMRVVDPAVDYRDDAGTRSRRDAPRLRRTDLGAVCAGLAYRPSGVEQSPELPEDGP